MVLRTITLGIVLFIVGSTMAVGNEAAPVYVAMVSHFDFPWNMRVPDISAFRSLNLRHPRMKWTHLFNPAAYTQSTPLLDEMEQLIFESRDVYGGEIGVHTHMYTSLVTAAGVPFRSAPDTLGPPPDCGSDPTGYLVPMTVYTGFEIAAILNFTVEVFASRGLGRPRSFCAGVYTTSVNLQRVLANLGFNTSAAAFPGGTQYGVEYGGCWEELSGWGGSVRHDDRPYPISIETIQPGGSPPFIWAESGPLGRGGPMFEIPQVCKIDWMVSVQDMKNIFDLHYALAEGGKATAVCLAIHDVNGQGQFSKFDEVLTYVDGFLERPTGPSVIYATLSEIRAAFLPAPGDWDADGDVDLFDFEAFEGCLTLPDGGIPVGCEAFDLSDRDSDVNWRDFGIFQRVYTGPGAGN